ncbi:MAG: PfkB family carbohydrate kinase [Bacteroidota bacterium]|nr:PfkB family carbohydrate kinase [Bacteroidota bacterium]
MGLDIKLNWPSLFDSFANKRVLVIGDIMLDAYYWGRVERISPEAPVPIVEVTKREYRLGGAANVALNMAKLGAKVSVASGVGKDVEAEKLLQLLADEEINTIAVIQFENDRPTTVKTRILGNNHQMIRIDSEVNELISASEENQLIELIIHRLLPNIDVIVFEDYDKGIITSNLIRQVIEAAKIHKCFIAVDPKRRNFHLYNHVDLFKPNLRELAEGLGVNLSVENTVDEVKKAGAQILYTLQAKFALITMSEKGMLLLEGEHSYYAEAHIRKVYDVSGAGDTVISVAALALSCGLVPNIAIQLANLAGGLVCEKLGVVPISRLELQLHAEAIFG